MQLVDPKQFNIPLFTILCDECEGEVPLTVCIGLAPDWEQGPSNICEKCLIKALDLIKVRSNDG